MRLMASSTSGTGVPPGFRFHPTDEELLLYYLKKKVSFDKFELEVIREVDLNKIEPWDLQERCRIGSAPQNEWYFFSHKDRKYPTGSRTNRATAAGFWKATGRDKCIRNSYSKIGMRKTLVFYRGRAPHGQKSDWIMHEYRLQDSADDGAATEDGWVVCRVFKKKCFFKIGGGGGGGGGEGMTTSLVTMEKQTSMEQTPSVLSSHYMLPNYYIHHNLYYSQIPTSSYNSHGQVQDLLTNHRPASGYEFSVLPAEPGAVMKPYDVDGGMRGAGDGCGLGAQSERNIPGHGEWAVLEGVGGRYNTAGAAPTQQMNLQMASQRGSSEMDLWGYGK